MKNQQSAKGRPRMSVAIIARNEQDVIGETLDSIRAIADEVIVWDSGSSDDTVSFCRKKGVKVFQGRWENDFSAARNACLAKAEGDWVLWLDAGERLDDALASRLREFIDTAADLHKVYMILVEIPPDGHCATGEQIAQPRLLPIKAGLKFEGRLRETLYQSIQEVGLEIAIAPGRIIRHVRQHGHDRKARLAHRNLDLLEMELSENEKPNPRLFLAQGEAYINLRDCARARESFIRAIELSQPGSAEMLEGYYGLLSGYNNDPLMRDAQMRVCLNALEVFPLDAQLLLAMGSYFQMCNRLDLATKAFETAVEFGRTNSTIWHLCELPEVAISCYTIALRLQGKDDEACQALEEGLVNYGQSPRLLQLAMDLYIKLGKADKAVEMAKRNGTLKGSEDPLILAIRGACKASKQEWTPALAYLQSAYLMGCRSPLCLRWLAVTLLSNGQGQVALPVLKEWQKLEPTNPELLAYLAELQENATANAKNERLAEEKQATNRQYRVDSPGMRTAINPIKIPMVPGLEVSERIIQ
jgi:glycosyltransferase involved in cell wall biosynthesis